MNRLVLIDGNAVLHRAYHAIPPLTAPDGSVVNAVYGFATMLIRLVGDLRPSQIAVVFDRPAPTFRKKLFAGYQSKRPKIDDNLISQIPKVHDLVSSFGIPIFEKDGFEADDIIGTLAKEIISRQTSVIKSSEDKKLNAESSLIDQVIIVTGDRDILQLVKDDSVLVYMPTKGLSEAKLYHEADVVERLGVTPDHITDFKGFAGDSSDNYPGVEGIGPKTAIDLINRFGSVEAVYAYIKKNSLNNAMPAGRQESGVVNHGKKDIVISSNTLKKLIGGEKMARLSKDLATIRTDVKLDTSLNVTAAVSLDTPEARKMLELLHFHSLLKRLGGGEEKQPQSKKTEIIKEKSKKGEQQELF